MKIQTHKKILNLFPFKREVKEKLKLYCLLLCIKNTEITLHTTFIKILKIYYFIIIIVAELDWLADKVPDVEKRADRVDDVASCSIFLQINK